MSPVISLDGSHSLDRARVGEKAYGLNRMTSLGLPVPPAFVLPTSVGEEYRDRDRDLSPAAWESTLRHLRRLEAATGQSLGDPERPLLVAVRSGAAESMPGMMDTVLNVGLTQAVRDAMVADGNTRWASAAWKRLRRDFANRGRTLSDDPLAQLREAIGLVLDSWDGARARAYRAQRRIPSSGQTAVTVQAMVFGGRDPGSGSGVVCSRNPLTGGRAVFGEWLPGAQGDELALGLRSPSELADLADVDPVSFRTIERAARLLEREAGRSVEIEFTIESGTVHLLQARPAKLAAPAALRVAVDLVREGIVEPRAGVELVTAGDVAQLLEQPDLMRGGFELCRGVAASTGVASGEPTTDVERALELQEKGRRVVLLRDTTAPEDVPAMLGAAAVATARGGALSHAAIVCREEGIPCVVGCGNRILGPLEDSLLTVDGAAGVVLRGDGRRLTALRQR